MVTKTLSVLLLSVFLTASVSFAQLPSLSSFGLGKTNTAPSPAIAQLTATKDKLANSYVQSTQTMTGALGKMLSSLGGGSDLLSKLSLANSLQSGNLTGSNTSALHQSLDMAG